MGGYPGDWAALQCHRAANREEVFERFWHHKRSVGMKAMVPQADAKSGTHPVEENGYCERFPTEHEQPGDRSQMKDRHGAGDGPVDFMTGR